MATPPGGPADAVDRSTHPSPAPSAPPHVDTPTDPFVAGTASEHDTPDGSLTVAPTQPRPGVVLIRVIGEVDMLTAPQLGDGVHAALETVANDREGGAAGDTAPMVVCDLGGVTFLGASGLDVFAAAQEIARARDVRLVVVAGHRTVRRPFRLTALDRGILLTDTHPALGRAPWVPGR